MNEENKTLESGVAKIDHIFESGDRSNKELTYAEGDAVGALMKEDAESEQEAIDTANLLQRQEDADGRDMPYEKDSSLSDYDNKIEELKYIGCQNCSHLTPASEECGGSCGACGGCSFVQSVDSREGVKFLEGQRL